MDSGPNQKEIDTLFAKLGEQKAPAPAPKKQAKGEPKPLAIPPKPATTPTLAMPGLHLGDSLFVDYSPEIEPDYIIDRWAERGELSMLVGPAKAGKGRLLAALACFAAIPDLKFPGLSKKAPSRTLIVLPEGYASLRRVMMASGIHYARHVEHLRERIDILNLAEIGGARIWETSGHDVIAARMAHLKEIGRRVDLLMIDSVSLMTDGEQIDPRIVNGVGMNLKSLATTFECGVIMAHHTNKAGHYEGSAMWSRHPVITRTIVWNGNNSKSGEWREVHFGACRDFDSDEKMIFRINPVLIDGEPQDGFAIIDRLLPMKEKDPKEPKAPRHFPRDVIREKAIDILAEATAPMTRAELIVEVAKYHPKPKRDTKSKERLARQVVDSLKDHADVTFDATEETFAYRRSAGAEK